MLRRHTKHLALAAVVVFAAIQFIQPDRTNPAVNPAAGFIAVAKPEPEVAAVFKRACFDCHSNETVWPLYSRIAPVSWLVAGDVKEARAHMNLSEWNLLSPEDANDKLRDACQEVKEGGMPLWQYRIMHPGARLTQADIEKICSLSVR